MTATQTPLLAFAVACERALIERDGTVSLIRIIDTITKGKTAQGTMPMTQVNIAVGLRSGDFLGRGRIEIVPRFPSGTQPAKGSEIVASVELRGSATGTNFIAEIVFPIAEEGTYWFDILFNDAMLTRVPLSVVSSELPTSEK